MTITDVHNITLKLGISMIFTQIRKVRDKKISDPICKKVIQIDLLKQCLAALIEFGFVPLKLADISKHLLLSFEKVQRHSCSVFLWTGLESHLKTSHLWCQV